MVQDECGSIAGVARFSESLAVKSFWASDLWGWDCGWGISQKCEQRLVVAKGAIKVRHAGSIPYGGFS